MKDRNIPCIHYICHGVDCKKGFKKVDTSKCKNCTKYQPRKVKNKPANIKIRRQKDKDRSERRQKED